MFSCFNLCLHFECVAITKKLIFTCPLLIGSEQTTDIASDWLANLHSANFSNSIDQKITMLEPINLPRLPSFLPNPWRTLGGKVFYCLIAVSGT